MAVDLLRHWPAESRPQLTPGGRIHLDRSRRPCTLRVDDPNLLTRRLALAERTIADLEARIERTAQQPAAG